MARRNARRLARLSELLAAGAPTSVAVSALVSEFRISERTAWRDIDEVYKNWAEEEQRLRPGCRLRRVRFLERIAYDAFCSQELPTAVAAVRQLCKIEGLEQVQAQSQARVQRQLYVATDGIKPVELMTSGERREEIQSLLAKCMPKSD